MSSSPSLAFLLLLAFQRTSVVKFTRQDEVKQFPFTTRLPRYSFVLFSLSVLSARFFSSLLSPFPLFSFPLLYSGSRSLSNFTLHSAPRFLRSFGKGFLFFLFFFLSFFFFFFPFFFCTVAFVQSVNTSNEVRSFLFFLSRVFFASLSTRSLLSQLPPLRRVCRRPSPRRQVLPLVCQSTLYIPRMVEKEF